MVHDQHQPGRVLQISLGKVPSLNAFYASKHWMARKKAKDLAYAEVMRQLDKMEKATFLECHIEARVNYRYDIDNSIMAVKFSLDAVKDWGLIQDDSPKYVTSVLIVRDKTIPKDTAKIFFHEGVAQLNL
jgi:hypothetical protein